MAESATSSAATVTSFVFHCNMEMILRDGCRKRADHGRPLEGGASSEGVNGTLRSAISPDRVSTRYGSVMAGAVRLELDPPQPAAVVAAVAQALPAEPPCDPWWQAGLEENLEP